MEEATPPETFPCWVRQPSSNSIVKENRPKPKIKGPCDVLVNVKAASVNPLDVKMSGGYGDTLITFGKKMKESKLSAIFGASKPEDKCFVLGRDFSGTVEAVGNKVSKFKAGDEVFGAVGPMVAGTHAHYTVATDCEVCLKPSNLTHVEAASIPYVALTFLAGFVNTAATPENMKDKRVHLNAAAGGVGSFATQYLKAIGCEVTVSVSKAAAEVVAKFNPDHVLDYTSDEYQEELQELTGFDQAYDFVGDNTALGCVKKGGSFSTAIHPMLSIIDEKGLIAGGVSAAWEFKQQKSKVKNEHDVVLHWIIYKENGRALEEVKNMIEAGKIKPLIDQVFPFDEIPAAFDKVGKGRGRGKVVIDIAGS